MKEYNLDGVTVIQQEESDPDYSAWKRANDLAEKRHLPPSVIKLTSSIEKLELPKWTVPIS